MVLIKQFLKKEYEKLLYRNEVLNALEAGGVDNWQWYGDSLRQYFGEED